MSALVDMVVGNLQIEPEEQKDARDIIADKSFSDPGLVLSYVKEAQEAAKREQGIWESAAVVAALFEKSNLPEPEDEYLVFLLDARDADGGDGDALARHRGRLDFLRGEAEEILYEDVRHDILWGWQGYIEFIRSIWQEETEEVISQITGVSRATAKRWIQGGTARSEHHRRVSRFSYLLYDLQAKNFWSEEEIRAWCQKKIKKIGESPVEFVRGHPYCYDYYHTLEDCIP